MWLCLLVAFTVLIEMIKEKLETGDQCIKITDEDLYLFQKQVRNYKVSVLYR